MSTKSYTVPDWSSISLHSYSLEVLKEGSIVGCLQLNEKAFYIVGRQPDICDIGLEHPSISRQHAVIQHGPTNIFLFDLQSPHGTYVNKTKILSLTYHPLHVGDIIKFGQSTRLYIVCGPEELKPAEYESENVMKVREKMKAHNTNKIKELSEGASWGFDDDAENDDNEEEGEDDDLHTSSSSKKLNLPDYVKNDENYERKYGTKFESKLDESTMNEKDKGIVEKVKKKEKKIQNMQEENRRIYLKENSQEAGLTEGQKSAVHRNDERIQVLVDEIELLEHEIMLKQTSRSSQNKGDDEMQSSKRSSAEGEDDMLDTTKETADSSTNWRLRRRTGVTGSSTATAFSALPQKSFTHSELCELKEQADAKLAVLQASLAEAEGYIREFDVRFASGLGDDVERAVGEAQCTERRGQLKGLRDDVSTTETTISGLERLIRVSAPALPSLVKSIKATPTTLPETHKPDKINPLSVAADVLVPAPPITASKIRKRETEVIGLAAFMDFDKGTSEETEAEFQANSATSMKSSSTVKKARVIGPSNSSGLHTMFGSKSVLEGGEVVWVPPVNQKGDGRTALNDRLGY
jgi:pSer/pThr/pTyr-binding forkhead associated (FHA) protein